MHGIHNRYSKVQNYIYNTPFYSVAPYNHNSKNDKNNTSTSEIMKANTGVSKTYLKKEHEKYLKNLLKLQNGPEATLPNNTRIKAIAKGILPLHPSLFPKALIYPQLHNESLLSIGQLCDEGCVAIFDKATLRILKNGKVILTGNRNLRDGLWDIPFKNHDIISINYIITRDKSKT